MINILKKDDFDLILDAIDDNLIFSDDRENDPLKILRYKIEENLLDGSAKECNSIIECLNLYQSRYSEDNEEYYEIENLINKINHSIT